MKCKLFVGTLIVLLAGVVPARLGAQNIVTPIVKPTPAGQLILITQGSSYIGPDPHVSGDLVSYDHSDGIVFTVRYFNLATKVDAGIPNDGTVTDFLADVRGSTIAFTRTRSNGDGKIFTFDTAIPGNPPVEVDPSPGDTRDEAQIGDQTIAWQDFGTNLNLLSTVIGVFDRTTLQTQSLTPETPGIINQTPSLSPDGTVIVWSQCQSSSTCPTWQATLSSGTWTARQLPSQVVGLESHPDTDGNIIVYSRDFISSGVPVDRVFWQPVGGGPENLLNLPGSAIRPSIGGGLIVFAYLAPGAPGHDLEIYNPATNVLYNLTTDAMPTDTTDKQVNDISITPDGKVRVVWQEIANVIGAPLNAYAYTFNLPAGDFNLGPISPLAISAGGSGSTSVGVNPINGFNSSVNLTVSGQPAGVMATLSPDLVTPSGGNPAASVLNVSLPPFIVPTNFTLTITGTSDSMSHTTTAVVSVTASTNSIGNLIGDLLSAGCIDNAGIANALLSKLSAAQSAISAGNVQTAINTLTALKNQLRAQAGKHVATSCTIAGVAFDPVTVLLADVQGLIDSLRVSMVPDPITGYVVDSTGAGVFGATVSIVDAGGNTVALSTTDITGFYFLATTGVLTPGASYMLGVATLPAGFANSTPANQPFTWQGTAVAFSNFTLN